MINLDKTFNILKNKIQEINEKNYNNFRIDRRTSLKNINRTFPAGDNYWPSVANHIKSVVENDRTNFFSDPEVMLHLAFEDAPSAYRILDKIRSHRMGDYVLNKCSTPPWGAPFVLKGYPFVAPTTLGHLANVLSIYELFGQNISSILDFGGGYGGFARCMALLHVDIEINIVDLPEMQYVQSQFLNATSSFGNYKFFNDIDDLSPVSVEIFNASFSFSETPLDYRERIEKFIVKNSKDVHITFQPSFNGIDNLKYMGDFMKRLEANGWLVKIEEYDWSGWDGAYLLCGRSRSALVDAA